MDWSRIGSVWLRIAAVVIFSSWYLFSEGGEAKASSTEERWGARPLSQMSRSELEVSFVTAEDHIHRLHLASALVRELEEDDEYWDYLVEEARAAIASDMPTPVNPRVDRERKPEPPAEFKQWYERAGMTWEQAWQLAMRHTQSIMAIALTEDLRSAAVLKEALGSSNQTFWMPATMGLSKLQDEEAIPLIIDRAKVLQGPERDLLAAHLVLFDNRIAEAAAEDLVENQALLEEFRKDRLQRRPSEHR